MSGLLWVDLFTNLSHNFVLSENLPYVCFLARTGILHTHCLRAIRYKMGSSSHRRTVLFSTFSFEEPNIHPKCKL